MFSEEKVATPLNISSSSTCFNDGAHRLQTPTAQLARLSVSSALLADEHPHDHDILRRVRTDVTTPGEALTSRQSFELAFPGAFRFFRGTLNDVISDLFVAPGFALTPLHGNSCEGCLGWLLNGRVFAITFGTFWRSYFSRYFWRLVPGSIKADFYR